MKKGNTGINLYFFAAFAFILVLVGQTMLCGMLLGFIILAERDEWLTKQVIQAFGLTVCSSVISRILDSLLVFNRIPIAGPIFYGFFAFIAGIVNLLFWVLAIVAIIRVAKGNDAGIPLLQKFSDWAYGAAKGNLPYSGENSTASSDSNVTDSADSSGQNNNSDL